jgi:wyosine [tRNA(Phe)-imidazoG37] synthetase (radical SAM superfamily)
MSQVFGPVPSRRLGLSLGVDLVALKTCSYDCLYCQVGKTTSKVVVPASFVKVEDVIAQVEKRLSHCTPDSITLAGSGEPTLFTEIDLLIRGVKELTSIRVALLTNGSLFWKEEIRERVLQADVIMPTLTSGVEETFQKIHRPHGSIDLHRVISGLKALRGVYRGLIWLEVILLAGLNDSDRELETLRSVIQQISPDRIQLNTVVRPPSDSRAKPLSGARLLEIRDYFGNTAEIIADRPLKGVPGEEGLPGLSVLEMIKRRPLSAMDASKAMGVSLVEAEDILLKLLNCGRIEKRDHSGEAYYLSHEKEDDR